MGWHGRSESFSFSRQAWFEWSAIQRGALMVELDGPNGKKIAVMNIHTTAGRCSGSASITPKKAPALDVDHGLQGQEGVCLWYW